MVCERAETDDPLAWGPLPVRDLPANAATPRAPRDLSGVDLRAARLAGAVLRGFRLRGACLEGAILSGADLRLTDLSEADLRGANLSGAMLARADLSFADLRGACLLTADLSESTASHADFREALLPMAVLRGALLRAADFRWARLDGARLCDADLDGAQFEGASLVFVDLSGAHLTAATDFSYAFLQHARFARTALTRHHIRRGIGEECADLAAARTTYLQLSQAFVALARHEDADWARYQAWRMATESHRPRNAVVYYRGWAAPASPNPHRPLSAVDAVTGESYLAGETGRDAASSEPSSADTARPAGRPSDPVVALSPAVRRVRLLGRRTLPRATFLAWHGTLWCVGRLAEWLTGYGTSLRRLVATLALLWSASALLYLLSGAVVGPDGLPADVIDALHYSAAAMTPLEPHPLTCGSALVRLAALVEGALGLVLLGALGAVATTRLRRC